MVDYEAVVREVFETYAPEKLGELPKVLKHFAGREEALVRTLEAKYGVVVRKDGTIEHEELVSDDGSSSYETDDGTTEPDPELDDLRVDFDMEAEVAALMKEEGKSQRERAAEFARAAMQVVKSRPPRKASRRRSSAKSAKSAKVKKAHEPRAARPASRKAVATTPAPKRHSTPRDEEKEAARGKKSALARKGAAVWVRDEDEAWVRGTVASDGGPSRSGTVQVKLEGRRGRTVAVSPADVEPVLSADTNLAQVDDLTKLPALHEPALLQALQERFARDAIYTFTGPILLAVNPFKGVKKMYGAAEAQAYMESSKGYTQAGSRGNMVALPPHAYKLADDAFRAMREQNGTNQSVLVSGESGAGKTETTKIVLNYLSYVSMAGRTKRKKAYVSDRVLRANPVLEAFGNAKTLRNDNSSRFGKLIQVQFDENRGDIKGAFIETYLLEKARVVHQGRGERNYHIFYELAAGATPEQRRRWHFPRNLRDCRYTANGTQRRDDVDDLAQFKTTIAGMQVLNFKQSDIERLFRGVVAVLHLGNIDFKERTNKEGMPAAKVANPADSLDLASALLEVNPDDLERVLTTRKISVGFGLRGAETVMAPLSKAAASDARDALAMNLYERLFGWLVWRTNLSIGMDDKQYEAMLSRQEARRKYKERQRRRGETDDEDDDEDDDVSPVEDDEDDDPFSVGASLSKAFNQALSVSGLRKKGGDQERRRDYLIGCLDIFGFEVFDHNSFEQLCINYANEQLQQQFNEFVFRFEQEEYEREGIDWKFVSFPDNSACIAMIEAKPMGLLALIDEECLFPKGTDTSLIGKLHTNMPRKHASSFIITQADRVNQSFTVRHFAGDVTYDIHGFCAKNRNELRQDAVDLVRSSGDRLISSLLPAKADAAAGGADMAAHFNNLMRDAEGGGGRARGGSLSGRGGGSGGGSQKLRAKTAGAHFRTQLDKLGDAIRTSDRRYIRCLKPNDNSAPGDFDRARMVTQLRYSGVLELVKVTRAGYPSRYALGAFVERFAVLSYGMRSAARQASKLVKSGDRKSMVKVCQKICDNAKLTFGEDYQIGQTKVFLRQSTLAYLEMKKAERAYDCVVVIQRAFRKYRADFQRQYSAIVLQRNVRGYLVRKEVVDILEQRALAAEIIQTNPHFQRWLDYIMRKSRAARRKKRKRRRRKPLWRPPKWYVNNRELVWWTAPALLAYLLPSILRALGRFLNNNPLVPFVLLLVLWGMATGAYGVQARSGEPFDPAMLLASFRRPRARARRRAPPPRSRAPARQRGGVSRRGGRARGGSVNVHRPQVSDKFTKRAARLRKDKSASRKSQGFELPPIRSSNAKFRGLRR